MFKINTINRYFLSLFLIGLIVLSFLGSVDGQTLNTGYSSEEPLQKGMLVTEKPDDPTKVIAVKNETLDKLKGVVVQQNDSPVTLAGEGQNIFVASTGKYDVLVSNENGPIAPGDYITVSSLAGVGMKAGDIQTLVVGRASAEFKGDGDSVGSGQEPNGKTVQFGRIPVVIEIARNPHLKGSEGNPIPRLLKNVSVSVAGKDVPISRIWMATVVFIASALVTGVMLYGGARSSLISVGRNPLSKGAIIKGLMQVVVLSLTVFLTGMFGVYLLLKL